MTNNKQHYFSHNITETFNLFLLETNLVSTTYRYIENVHTDRLKTVACRNFSPCHGRPGRQLSPSKPDLRRRAFVGPVYRLICRQATYDTCTKDLKAEIGEVIMPTDNGFVKSTVRWVFITRTHADIRSLCSDSRLSSCRTCMHSEML